MTPSRKYRTVLRMERLEARCLLAGNVTAEVQGETLVILGDAEDNSVVLTYESTTRTYQVSGLDAGGSITTINGVDTSQPENVQAFAGVKHVVASLGGGNDRFEVGSAEAVDTVISKWLWIGMGDGDDVVVLGRPGNPAGGADPVATLLRTGTSVTVDLGGGDDELRIANADIGLWLSIFAGDGNDQVIFDTAFTPAGQSQAQLFPVRVRGTVNIHLGGGEDELQLHNAILNGKVNILDGAGPAHLNLQNLNIGNKLDIDTGHDDDEIAINFVVARKFTLDSNSGSDDVDITNSKFKLMIIKVGGDRDHVLVSNVKVTYVTHFDGGPGGSSLIRGPGNRLRGLTKRQIG